MHLEFQSPYHCYRDQASKSYNYSKFIGWVLKTATTIIISSKYNSIRLLYLHMYILIICIFKFVCGGEHWGWFSKNFFLNFYGLIGAYLLKHLNQVNNIEHKSLHDSHESMPLRCAFKRNPARRSIISWHLQLLHLWNLQQHLHGSHTIPRMLLAQWVY